jgi:hypothetical protein
MPSPLTAERPFRFEGRGFYRPDGAIWRGQWFDSTGATRPLSGTVTGTTLVTEWGDDATERGRTTYRLEAVDSLAGDRRSPAPRRAVARLREPSIHPKLTIYRYCELIAKKPGESGLLAVALPDSQA